MSSTWRLRLIAVPRGENEEMDLFVATQHGAFTQVRERLNRQMKYKVYVQLC